MAVEGEFESWESVQGYDEYAGTSSDASSQSNECASVALVDVAYQTNTKKDQDFVECLIQVSPPDVSVSTGKHIICVIDVSGSMQCEAGAQNEKGNVETTGLSVLDVVKHAMRTIVHVMRPEDELSIVKYSTNGEVIASNVTCNTKGRKKLMNKIDGLVTECSTNMWAGLRLGLDLAMKSDKTSALFCLTDGQPNVVPPRGHMHALEAYVLERCKGKLPCAISTFGFGYDLQSQLLCEIARFGSGTYSFIPDAGLVGTVFINAISNWLSVCGFNAKLRIKLSKDVKLDTANPLMEVYRYEKSKHELVVNIGPLNSGQPRSFVLSLVSPRSSKEQPWVSTELSFTAEGGNAFGKQRMSNNMPREVLQKRISEVKARYTVIKCIASITEPPGQRYVEPSHFGMASSPIVDLSVAQNIVCDALKQLDQYKDDSAWIPKLLLDVRGQVQEAVSKKTYMDKWGKHYLPSLRFAHTYEFCNNFKDPGVQQYGVGISFLALRDTAEDAFAKLPPPKPTTGSSSVPISSTRMRNLYYNTGAGCFAGSCSVLMGDGCSTKLVNELCKGDFVASLKGAPARVLCVVKTIQVPRKLTKMVQLRGGLLITPYHPVLVCDKWEFPRDLSEEIETDLECVYNVCLEDGHVMEIDGTLVVTLGHNFTEGCVKHPYFGTRQVIDDLSCMPGWNEGFIELTTGAFIRDPATNLVSSIQTKLQ